MPESVTPETFTRGPVDAIRTSLRNGINRYRSMKDAPESRRLLGAFALNWIGARFNTIALVVLSYKLGDGALGVGGMLALTLLPLTVFQPIGGTLVDKFPGKRLLVICYALFTLSSLAYLLLIPFPSIWLLYGIAFVTGTLQSVEGAAYEVRLMMLTPSDKRGTANALQSMAAEAGEIIGPLLGGLILAIAGPAPLFILNSLSFVNLGLAVAKLPESVPGAQRESDGSDTEAAEAQRGGYAWLLRRPAILTYMAMSIGVGALAYGIVTLFVTKALDLGMNDGSIGVFFAAIGVGALTGGTFAGMGEYQSQKALGLTGVAAALGAISAFGFGIAPVFLLALVALFIFGLIGAIQEIPALTYYQNSLPETVYGRFFSSFMMAGSLGGLGGSLLIPILAERYSMAISLAVVAVPVVVFGLLYAIRGGGMSLRSPYFPVATNAAAVFSEATPHLNPIETDVPMSAADVSSVEAASDD